MMSELDSITDQEKRLAWLRDRGRKDANLLIARGPAARSETFDPSESLSSSEERVAYYESHYGRIQEYISEREAAGNPVVSPDYRGPLTEKDWWRGVHVIPSPDRPARPERPQRP